MGRGSTPDVREVIIIGGGLAGLFAALYLGRSRRDTQLIHSGRSMGKWEADVQNYLEFPDGIDGADLLTRGHAQVTRFHVEIIEDEVRTPDSFTTRGDVYHDLAEGRELWIDSLGLPAVLPPPEEEKDVKSAGEAARAKKSRKEMLVK